MLVCFERYGVRDWYKKNDLCYDDWKKGLRLGDRIEEGNKEEAGLAGFILVRL